jgi:serine acetyltransferase
MRVVDDASKLVQFLRSLLSQIREDYCAHGRDWTKPGFRAVAVHRFGAALKEPKERGVLAARVAWGFWRLMFRYIRNHYGIELPASTIVGRRFVIGHQSGIVIHHKSVIGDDCAILQNVTIGAAVDYRILEAPTLGNRVKVGCGASLIGRIVIGDDVVIGPNVTVMTNIPAGTTVCATPPRFIKLPWGNRTRSQASQTAN